MLHEVSFFVDLSAVNCGLKNFLSHLTLGSFHVLGDDMNLVERQFVILELYQCQERHIFGFSCGKDRPWKLFSCWGIWIQNVQLAFVRFHPLCLQCFCGQKFGNCVS